MNDFYKSIVLGVTEIYEENGWTELRRYNGAQLEYWKERGETHYKRARCTSSVKLEFYTKGGEIFFEYKINPGNAREYYSIDLHENGEWKFNVSENTNEAEGTFRYEIAPSEEEKRITVYLPTTAQAVIKGLKLPADYKPHRREKKILCIGDSGFQGYNPDHFQNTIINVFGDKYDAELINHSVGGECFNERNVFPVDFTPDFIICSFGVNDWACNAFGSGERARAFYKKVREIYPEVTIYSLIPKRIPYVELGGDYEDLLYEKKNSVDGQTLEDVRIALEKMAEEMENVIAIDGRNMLDPYEPGVFYSDNVHLTDKGNLLVGISLAEKMMEFEKI